eukprot:3975731-Pyramimonas_sp.AAC.1
MLPPAAQGSANGGSHGRGRRSRPPSPSAPSAGGGGGVVTARPNPSFADPSEGCAFLGYYLGSLGVLGMFGPLPCPS